MKTNHVTARFSQRLKALSVRGDGRLRGPTVSFTIRSIKTQKPKCAEQ